MKRDNLLGKTFGKLKVVDLGETYVTPKGQKKTVWICQCSCGNTELIPVMATHLKTGHTTSCGCEKIRITRENNSRKNTYDLSGEYGIGYTHNTNVPFLFDLEDYDKIKNYCWREDKNIKGYIVARDITQPHKEKEVLLHRIIMNCPKDKQVDHIFHNVRDNRKKYLRIVTPGQNNYNRTPAEGKEVSGIYQTKNGKWNVYIGFEKESIYLGVYDSKEEAIKIRKEAEKEYYKEYAYKQH